MKFSTILMTLGALGSCAWALPQAANVEAALPIAQKEGRDIMLEFTGKEWCPPCIHLRTKIMETAEFEKAVGDKYVYEYMMQQGCRLGGEQSGHIIFSKYASTGDGILTSLKMMEVMMAKKKTLFQLCEGLTIYPQVLGNIPVADKTAAQADPDVQKAVAEIAARLGDSGRILVRESGTEPLIRVMVEAGSQELCRESVDYVVDAIRRKGYAE